MKKVLFAVSLVVNIALAGGLFYTITEMNKLDDQRESLAISNEQYKRKLDEASSTNVDTQEAVESSTIVYSNESSETLTNSARSTAPATETVSQKATITIGSKVFTFIVNGLTIEHDSSRTGKMTELSHEFPVIVTTPSATLNGILVQDNNDNNCYIMVDGQTLYRGTYQ